MKSKEKETEGLWVGKEKERYDFTLKLLEQKSTTRGYWVYRMEDKHGNLFIAFDGRENWELPHYQNTSDGLFQLYDSICKDIKPDNDTIKDFLNRMSFIKHNTKHDVIKHIPELNKLGENYVNTRTN